jgi:hypothetical protein
MLQSPEGGFNTWISGWAFAVCLTQERVMESVRGLALEACTTSAATLLPGASNSFISQQQQKQNYHQLRKAVSLYLVWHPWCAQARPHALRGDI